MTNDRRRRRRNIREKEKKVCDIEDRLLRGVVSGPDIRIFYVAGWLAETVPS